MVHAKRRLYIRHAGYTWPARVILVLFIVLELAFIVALIAVAWFLLHLPQHG
jgi:hypothetical protein